MDRLRQHEISEAEQRILNPFTDEKLMLLGEAFEVISEPTDLVAVRSALQSGGIDYESAEASFVPSLTVEVDKPGAVRIFRLIDALEDSDDVQNVFGNFDVPDDVMAELDDDS